MNKTLRISGTQSLPLEAVTQTFAILGIRGSGKTNTGVDMAEEMLKAGQQIVVLDPVDVWWGLRSSGDGKSPGIPITIIGGEHGDVPLEGASGAIIADFVVESGTSIVLSLRHLSMNEQRRFAADFAERLYHRKGAAEFRDPLHLFIGECDEFIPQNIAKGGERMFGAFDRLVRRGRSSGIGMTMISQRPQVVNKSVLSQCETLICHRLLHKLDRAAVDDWISAHDTAGRRDEFMQSLASLPRGTAWLWSPAWLDIFAVVAMRKRETFDSSSTPAAGHKAVRPKQIAPVNLDALRLQLKETIEKAEADDPRKLKADLAAMRLQLARKPAAVAGADTARVTELEEEVARLTRTLGTVSSYSDQLKQQIGETKKWIQQSVEDAFGSLATYTTSIEGYYVPEPRKDHAPSAREAVAKPAEKQISESTSGITTAMQKVLDALAKLEACGVVPAPRMQVAFFAGYSNIRSGGFITPVGQLANQGYIVTGDGSLRLTELGRSATRHVNVPATTEELQAQIFSILGSAEGKLLRMLIEKYPRPVSRVDLAAAAGYANIRSGGFISPVGRLTSLGLAEVPSPGLVAGTSLLFL